MDGAAVVPGFGVPLFSQEGLTCRLLPGATAPYPALDQEFSLLAPAAAKFVVVETAAQAVAQSVVSQGNLVRVGSLLHCRLRPALPSCRRFWYEVA